jgi:predicted small integral membrane protein
MRSALPSPRALRLDSLLGGPTQRRTFGALLVAGWAVYTTVVVASNLSDLLASFGWIHPAFRSGNLAFIQTATRIYFHSRPIDQLLLGCVVVWETGAAALLWYGAVAWTGTVWRTVGAAEAGLIVTALLWVAFATATEVFVAYDRGVNESAYWVLAIANLVTLVVVTQFRREMA